MSKTRKAFTLIELMVVILIVAILAAVLAPMLSGRINEAKWTEGKAGAGTIATALRAYWAEHGAAPATIADAGIDTGDLDGKYFTTTSYVISDVSEAAGGEIYYTITVTPDAGKDGSPSGSKQLINDATHDSEWVDVAAAG